MIQHKMILIGSLKEHTIWPIGKMGKVEQETNTIIKNNKLFQMFNNFI